MKKILITLCVLAVIAGVAGASTWYVFSKPGEAAIAVKNYPSQGKNVIAFGDSLTKGYGASYKNDYVTLLSEKLGVPIINEGKIGDTTTSALRRVKGVLENDPKLVIIMLGGNDILQRIPEERTFENLEKIITAIQDKGAVVVLAGVNDGGLGGKYRENFDSLAKRLEVAYVPDILEGILGNKANMYDLVHPNDAGYRIIVDRLYPAVSNNL